MNIILFKNMRVMAKYYTRIYTKRMANLLDLTEDATEEFLSYFEVNSRQKWSSKWYCNIRTTISNKLKYSSCYDQKGLGLHYNMR